MRPDWEPEQVDLHVQLSSGCSLHGLAEDAQEASSPARPGWKVGTGGSPGARAGGLRRPEDPTHRACPQGPPGCQMISAGAVCSDD